MIKFPINYNLELLNMFVDELYDLKIDLQTDFTFDAKILEDDTHYYKTLNLPIYIKYIPAYLGIELLSSDSKLFEFITIQNIGMYINSNMSLQRCLLNYNNTLNSIKGYKESSIYLYVDKESLSNIKYGIAIFIHHNYLRYGTDKDSLSIAINDYFKSTYDKYKIMYENNKI